MLLEQIDNALKTLKEMLSDRNFDKPLENVTLDDLKANLSKNDTFSINVNEQCQVMFLMAPKFKTSTALKTSLQNEQINHFIIISREKLKTMNLRAFQEFMTNKKIEFWSLDELQFNISKHAYVPKHEIVPDNEVSDIMKMYFIKVKTNFPIILKTDPMARYLNAKSGQLVKITRNTPNSVDYIVYRYCV